MKEEKKSKFVKILSGNKFQVTYKSPLDGDKFETPIEISKVFNFLQVKEKHKDLVQMLFYVVASRYSQICVAHCNENYVQFTFHYPAVYLRLYYSEFELNGKTLTCFSDIDVLFPNIKYLPSIQSPTIVSDSGLKETSHFENKIPYVDTSRLERLQEGKPEKTAFTSNLKSKFVECISPTKFQVVHNGELPKETSSIEFTNEVDGNTKDLVFSLAHVIALIYSKNFSVSCSKYGFKIIFKSSLDYLKYDYSDFKLIGNEIHCVSPIEALFPQIFPPEPPPLRVIKDIHIPPAFFLAFLFLIVLLVSFILSH